MKYHHWGGGDANAGGTPDVVRCGWWDRKPSLVGCNLFIFDVTLDIYPKLPILRIHAGAPAAVFGANSATFVWLKFVRQLMPFLGFIAKSHREAAFPTHILRPDIVRA